jgi:hypothetical protein
VLVLHLRCITNTAKHTLPVLAHTCTTALRRLGSAAAFNAAGAVNAAVAAVVLIALAGRVLTGITSSSSSGSNNSSSGGSAGAAVAGRLNEDVLLGSWGHALQRCSKKSE